ncbi:hypothetical protein V8C42DRAFT_37607 [Trichoderma barbatum]
MPNPYNHHRADFSGRWRLSGLWLRSGEVRFRHSGARGVMSRSLAQTCDGQLRMAEARLCNVELNSRLNRHCDTCAVSQRPRASLGDDFKRANPWPHNWTDGYSKGPPLLEPLGELRCATSTYSLQAQRLK